MQPGRSGGWIPVGGSVQGDVLVEQPGWGSVRPPQKTQKGEVLEGCSRLPYPRPWIVGGGVAGLSSSGNHYYSQEQYGKK